MSHSDVQHICGKLNHYSAALQAGRIHTRSWYIYSVYLDRTTAEWLNKLLADSSWWIDVLDKWGRGDVDCRNIPILNAAVLKADPDLIQCTVGDASGPDGLGYYYGSLDDHNPTFVARQWLPEELFYSSTHAELKVLAERIARLPDDSSCVMIWVTDSLAAAYMANKGTARTLHDTELLTKLFECADRKRVQIFAVWVSRDLNTFSDFLSHLAVLSNRSSMCGKVRELAPTDATRTDTGASK
jgi:hypothetical protein